jgi:cyclohexa-1,5-dienecarbonyl-CoA hydratase
MMEEIAEALRTIEVDTTVRVIVFRAAGEKALCAGVSIQDHLPDRIREMILKFHEIFRLLARTDKVTIAAVHGHCLGGGLELAGMCDLIVASEDAQFGQPEIRLGQLPPVGVILLPRLIGYRKAAELMLTGKSIGAHEAEALGLVNRIVPRNQLARSLEELVAELTAMSGAALRLAKESLRRVAGFDFEAALQESEQLFLNRLIHTDDAKEGVVAFLEKRAAKWNHRL